jgi:hypothetical protein
METLPSEIIHCIMIKLKKPDYISCQLTCKLFNVCTDKEKKQRRACPEIILNSIIIDNLHTSCDSWPPCYVCNTTGMYKNRSSYLTHWVNTYLDNETDIIDRELSMPRIHWFVNRDANAQHAIVKNVCKPIVPSELAFLSSAIGRAVKLEDDVYGLEQWIGRLRRLRRIRRQKSYK